MTGVGPVGAGEGPTGAELAAIVAAVEMAWLRPVVLAEPVAESSVWRFSGRWWSQSHTVQRQRPWVQRS